MSAPSDDPYLCSHIWQGKSYFLNLYNIHVTSYKEFFQLLVLEIKRNWPIILDYMIFYPLAYVYLCLFRLSPCFLLVGQYYNRCGSRLKPVDGLAVCLHRE